MIKLCEYCGEEFVLVPGRGWKNRITCYSCTDKDKRRSYRNKHLKRKYGITHFQFTEILKSQNTKCKICETELIIETPALRLGNSRNGNEACVDHDHATGKVRGILCFHCNTGIGHLFDNPKTVENIIHYLNQ